jgi:hypothetical protein
MKLRHLVDAGCVFVGHDLQQDFRMINIVVPQEQVVDACPLYASTSSLSDLLTQSWARLPITRGYMASICQGR